MITVRGDESAPNAPGASVAPPPPPGPLLHHPIVALSLILVTASLAQIGVWLVHTRLPPSARLHSSAVAAHGMLFEEFSHRITRQAETSETTTPPEVILFLGCLAAALVSGVAWYGVGRTALGPTWGLWVGLCWVVHPGFAFLAPRISPLAFVIASVPLAWWLLLRWRRTGHWPTALAAGFALGVTSLLCLQGIILAATALAAMLVTPIARRRRLVSVLVLGLGWALLVIPWHAVWVQGADRFDLKQRLRFDLWRQLDSGDGSRVAEAARARAVARRADSPSDPVAFLATQFRQSPRDTLAWFGRRGWQTLYTTDDGRLQRPLLVLQIVWLLPALWGFWVAVHHKPWRWMAVTGGLFGVTFWSAAALAEPLARNLTPVGGLGILFGLLGVADLYERIFGRRLTAIHAAEGTPRLRPPDR